MTFPILPEQASKVAEQTDNLYWGLICASAAVCLIALRANPKPEIRNPKQTQNPNPEPEPVQHATRNPQHVSGP